MKVPSSCVSEIKGFKYYLWMCFVFFTNNCMFHFEMVDASVTGSDGCVLKLRETRGILLIGLMDVETRFDEIKQMQARDDDILICGYPKCGTNWIWEVVQMLLNNSTDYVKTSKTNRMLEFVPAPMSVITGEFGSYYKYIKQWDRDIKEHPEIPTITLFYEDLKQDFVKETRRLFGFLNIHREESFLEAIREACTFKKMKDAKDSGPINDIFREGTSIYRKGGVGDWKNWFTVAQSAILDKVYEDEMKGVDIKFKYVL